MSSIDNIAAAFESLKQSHEAHRLSHAYIVAGAPRGDALALAESLLRLLFCEHQTKPCGECPSCRRVTSHEHPDILWVEPEKKSRILSVDQIRDLNLFIGKTAYSGSWKAGVLICADRLNESSANAFLKTLEEPPANSLLLLLTDSPQSLLPTIQSRCQRIVLSTGAGDDAGSAWSEQLMTILRLGVDSDVLNLLKGPSLLTALLDQMEESIEKDFDEAETDEGEKSKEIRDARIKARLLEARSGMMRRILLWHRDVLLYSLSLPEPPLHFPGDAAILRRQAAQLTPARAMKNVQAVESMARLLERNLSAELVFDLAWLQMAGKSRVF
ncbi:MAG: DNA polymerase III subunit [Lentisphaerota bacterium]